MCCCEEDDSTLEKWPKSNWPKSKLAEVECPRFGQTWFWPKMVWPNLEPLAEGVRVRRVVAQTFAFFFPLPPQFPFFLPSLRGLLVEFWWCLKRRDPQMRTFGEPKRVDFKNTTKIHEEREERMNIVAGEGKKRNFGRSFRKRVRRRGR